MGILPGIKLSSRTTIIYDDGTGIIKPSYDSLPAGIHNEFQLYFKSLFPKLSNLIWVFDAESFYQFYWSDKNLTDEEIDKYEALYESAFLNPFDRHNYYFYYNKPQFFEKYSIFIRNSWNFIWGFDSNNISLHEIININFEDCYKEEIISKVEILFYNFDGLNWSCFSRDSDLLLNIKKENCKNEFTEISETDYIEVIDYHNERMNSKTEITEIVKNFINKEINPKSSRFINDFLKDNASNDDSVE